MLCRAGEEASLTEIRVRLELSQRGLILWQCLPCAASSDEPCRATVGEGPDGRALEGDKRPESRGRARRASRTARSANLIMETQRTTGRTALERMSDSEKVARRY